METNNIAKGEIEIDYQIFVKSSHYDTFLLNVSCLTKVKGVEVNRFGMIEDTIETKQQAFRRLARYFEEVAKYFENGGKLEK